MLYLSEFKSVLDKIQKVCYNPVISERNNFSKAFSSLTKNQIPKGGAWLLTVTSTTSGIANSHGLTGGVYKARERIHRDIADSRLLAIPAS